MTIAPTRRARLPGTVSLAEAAGRTWDVLVIGAGPAGSVAARELARRGATVLLVDRAAFPRYKVCGCCLNRRALSMLARVGLGELPSRLGARPLARFDLCCSSCRVSLPLPGGASLSREVLDSALVTEAIRSGVQFLPETTARIEPDRGEPTRRITLQQGRNSGIAAARVAVAADGLSRRSLSARPEFFSRGPARSRVGLAAVLPDGPGFYEDGVISMACAERGYAGVVRLEDGRLNVAAAVELLRDQREKKPGQWIADVFRRAGLPAPEGLDGASWKGTGRLTRQCHPLTAPGVFVLGDAAGYVEPFTGEGMAWAMASAVLVAPLAVEAIGGWKPALAGRWQRLYRRHIGRRQQICRIISRLLRHPRAVSATILALRRAPWLAGPIVAKINSDP